MRSIYCSVVDSVADPDPFDPDPDPALHFNTDPDPCFSLCYGSGYGNVSETVLFFIFI